jgi:Fur family peroxide stress response transcriptional regulator
MDISMDLDGTLQVLRGKGFKITPQRVGILSYLNGNKNHPTAKTIFEDLKPQYPNMSFATVYNTMQALAEAGLVQEIVAKEKSHFDPDTSDHDHAFCLQCGAVFDLPPQQGRSFSLPEGFTPQRVVCVVYGTCAGCSHPRE